MKTIFAVAFALAVALSGVSGMSSAWAGGGTPRVSPRHDRWTNWPARDLGHRRGGFHDRRHFRGHGRPHYGNHVIIAPGGPRVVPGYWAWTGYAWVWVPAYWSR